MAEQYGHYDDDVKFIAVSVIQVIGQQEGNERNEKISRLYFMCPSLTHPILHWGPLSVRRPMWLLVRVISMRNLVTALGLPTDDRIYSSNRPIAADAILGAGKMDVPQWHQA